MLPPALAANTLSPQRVDPSDRTIKSNSLMIAAGVTNSVATLKSPAARRTEVLHAFDFTDFDQRSVKDWLGAKGFAFKADADDHAKFDLTGSPDGLVIEAKKSARALLVHDGTDVAEVGKIRINWKVDQYPQGANYDRGIRNEALMVMVFFGRDRIASGSVFVPDSPYFIGLFLCDEGSVRKAHVGRYFQKGGRYVCLDQPEEGEAIVSEYNLSAAFKKFFPLSAVPALSGVAIQTDTTDSKSAGKSKGSISSVEFLK